MRLAGWAGGRSLRTALLVIRVEVARAGVRHPFRSPDLFAAVSELVSREDRTPKRPVFQGFGADRFRTALTRACNAVGVPHFSPHDLRHRRVSLMHEQGISWAPDRRGSRIRRHRHDRGTYTHVLSDGAELDYETMV